GGDDGGTMHPKGLCPEYCQAALKNCSGAEFELYPDLPYCLAVCAALPQGTRADLTGNTVGCRLHFAQLAARGETGVTCKIAGPGGDGVCGENCESWCTLDHNLCPDIYATQQDCLDACHTFPVTGKYNDQPATQSGNTFECRLYHV